MTRRPFTPRPYQRHMIDWQHTLDRCALWAGMGTGKTVATLFALDARELVDEGPTLVLAPLRVAESTWPDEARKWAGLSNIEVSPVIGPPSARRAALKRPATVYTTNYENVPWLVEELGDRWPFRRIIADESTRLKSLRLDTRRRKDGSEYQRRSGGGKRARELARVAWQAHTFVELTGTPSPNGLVDLWGQAWYLDKGQRLGRVFTAFKNRWFQSIPAGDSGRLQLKLLLFAQEQIQARMRDIALTIDPRDWFDLKDPIVNVVRVDLPKRARRIYEAMEREMFASIQGTPVEAVSAAARTIKCLQLANGAVYLDEQGNWADIHDAKIQALDSIVAEASGASILVAYHFKSDLARLLRAFPFARHLDRDPQTIRDWNAGKIRMLLAHPASAGHGLNLQDGGNILVVFGHWWNLEEYQQIVERIGPVRQAQAGHDRPVFIYQIVATDTVDELVMARRESKREVQDLLLEAAKRRRP